MQRETAPHGTLVVADYQTTGRGRNGRAWVSAPGENLLFSVLLHVEAVEQPAILPLMVGHAVCVAIDDLVTQLGRGGGSANRPLVKWPNDVLLGGHKVAGILCDRHGDMVIVGVGVTCNQRHGLPTGQFSARSIGQLLDVRVDRWALLEGVLQHLHQLLDAGLRGVEKSVSSIEDRLYGTGTEVSIDEAPRGLPDRGVVVGLGDDGALLLRDVRGHTRRYYSGRLLPSAVLSSSSVPT